MLKNNQSSGFESKREKKSIIIANILSGKKDRIIKERTFTNGSVKI